ncbi:hypothetical protein [Mesobacillus stamsii]|uniref:Phage protein n=1 Tax=Mesobacillus stamsii TaxID=225347 RepID=A0ABU0FXY0_9BACI|nr:hypothetical protein [Mesobacillus stamsii]MDQ0414189.1 hypothetical protein [Mesobacillus stamsii]
MKKQTEIDFKQLEKQYGADLVEEIKMDLDYATEHNHEWKFEIIEETTYFITFAFVYSFSTRFYEVSKKRKEIDERHVISRYKCKKIIELMDSIDQDE